MMTRVCITLLLCWTLSSPLLAAQQPNIVLIFADDLGWKDVGYQGSKFIETPRLDRLAQEGMVFTSGYAAAGNCAPSRACLLSGNYTPRHHVYAVASTDRGPKEEQRLIPIANKNGLSPDNVTMADALKAAGYATGIFGKWHLDGPDGASPAEQGFGTVFESQAGWGQSAADNPKRIYSLTEAACQFMEQNRDKPFFVYLPHYAIHSALQARTETLQKFKSKPSAGDQVSALYAACTYDLDDGIGILLDKLTELELDENTLVVFTSDNGATQQSSQEPLRGSKGGYYEGGIREPWIVRWPGVTTPGSRCDVPVINQDLFPTFLAAAGVNPPAGKVLDGESLLPLLSGAGTLQRQSIFWHFPGYLNKAVNRGRDLDVRTDFRTRPVSVIRQGDWKLHLFLEEWVLDGGREKLATNAAVELYNLKDDVGEHHNLAGSHTAQRDKLLDDLLAWQQSVNALIPTERNPVYAPGSSAAKAKGKKGLKK